MVLNTKVVFFQKNLWKVKATNTIIRSHKELRNVLNGVTSPFLGLCLLNFSVLLTKTTFLVNKSNASGKLLIL